MQLQPTDCSLAREALSAQLDGELADVELDRLETHILLCPDCSAWAEQVRDATARLRGAPLEEPAGRILLPRLRRGWRVGAAVAMASAAAVVATTFVPAQHASLGSRQSLSRVSGLVGIKTQHFTISRLTRLEDGIYLPVSTPPDGFEHV